MSIQRYYPPLLNYPTTVQAIIERCWIYIAQLLYDARTPEQIRDTIRDRIFLSDINAGNDIALGDSAEYFQQTNGIFPFTASGIGEREFRSEVASTYAQRSMVYIDCIGYVALNPYKFYIPMVSFFSRPEDWNIAWTKLITDNGALTRLKVPIRFFDVEWSFTIDVAFNPLGSGSYSSAFEEYLRVNKIWDIQHTLEITYYEYNITSPYGGNVDPNFARDGLYIRGNPTQPIYPVDDMLVSLLRIGDGFVYDTLTIPLPPEITTVTPTNESTSVLTNTSIVINFNTAMMPDVVEDSFSITPYAEGHFTWDGPQSTILTYTPLFPLPVSTNHIITITKFARAGNGQSLEKDYTFSFNTGVV